LRFSLFLSSLRQIWLSLTPTVVLTHLLSAVSAFHLHRVLLAQALLLVLSVEFCLLEFPLFSSVPFPAATFVVQTRAASFPALVHTLVSQKQQLLLQES